jgi:hypothetical protein
MPTEPQLLEDARNWVEKWPDAVGHTSLLSAFLMADEHWNADCWWVALLVWRLAVMAACDAAADCQGKRVTSRYIVTKM